MIDSSSNHEEEEEEEEEEEKEEERPKPSDALTVAGSCIFLLNTVPARHTVQYPRILYDAYMALLILSLFISADLYIYSMQTDSDHNRRVMKVGKRRMMTVTVALVAVSVTLRSTIGLSVATVELVLPLLIIEAAVVLVSLYCYLLPKKQPARTIPPARTTNRAEPGPFVLHSILSIF